jgi:hypothetical protein
MGSWEFHDCLTPRPMLIDINRNKFSFIVYSAAFTYEI